MAALDKFKSNQTENPPNLQKSKWLSKVSENECSESFAKYVTNEVTS